MSIRKVAKSLGLKKLSAALNFTTSLSLNGKSFKVPVLHNMGIENTKVKGDFIFKLFNAVELDDIACFVDIGVNVGQTLLKFRSCRDNPYYGFEPNPACVHYLNNLISVNNMNNTIIIPVGLSSSSTVAKFFLKSEADTAGTMVGDLRPDYYAQDEVNYVPVYTMDSLDVLGNNRIGLIKIDVEGAESDVLLGMVETIKKHQPVIVCEVLDCHTEENVPAMQQRADKLVATVHSLNYEIYRLDHSESNITYEKQSTIQLKKWTPESEFLNDYIFLPEGTQFSDVISL